MYILVQCRRPIEIGGFIRDIAIQQRRRKVDRFGIVQPLNRITRKRQF